MEYIMWRIVFLAIFLKVAYLTPEIEKPQQILNTEETLNINPSEIATISTAEDTADSPTTPENETTDVNDCQQDPCQHGGTCTDEENDYSCKCVLGYTGVNCETNVNDCQQDLCQHGGTCTDKVNDHSCKCVLGYTGANCETNINDCHQDLCQYGGTCTDKVNNYSCECVPGYKGFNCETNINECHSNPCQNGSTCLDKVNNYSCECAPGYKGVNCEKKIKCAKPKEIANGHYSFINLTYGSEASFQCNQNYKQTAGDKVRTCQANNTWNGTDPVCVITCNIPSKVDHAKSNQTLNQVLGSTIVYTCDPDYQLTTGNLTRTCKDDRNWSGFPPDCKLSPGALCLSSSSNQCVLHASCIGEIPKRKCACGKGFYDSDLNETNIGGLCVPEKKLGERCTLVGKDTECNNKPFTLCAPQKENIPICRCDDTSYIENETCVLRPFAPVLELTSTNETIEISVSRNDRRINGTLVFYREQNGLTTRNKTFHGVLPYQRMINGLSSGTCYNFTFYSLIGDAISHYSKELKYCTEPNPPLSVKVLKYYNSSILIGIKNGTGNFDNYVIEIEGVILVETMNTTVHLSRLLAGHMYDINVKTKANGLNSSSLYIRQATNPNKPTSLQITNQTTNTITINVHHGNGMVEVFFVQVNETYFFLRNAWNSSNTQITIHKLIPGKLYNNISVTSESNKLRSEAKQLQQHATNPDPICSWRLTNHTLKSISLNVVHGNGIVQSFIITVNKTYSLERNATTNTSSTNVTVPNLTPGILYDKIMIQSVSHGLKSNGTYLLPVGTYPDVPKSVNITNQTTNTLCMIVVHGMGMLESINIILNESYSVEEKASTNRDSTQIDISNLTPGTLYDNIQIRSVSHGLYSAFFGTMEHATNPDVPKSVNITSQTTNTLRMIIFHGMGMLESINITLNESYSVEKKASTNRDSTQIDISNLTPGTLYDNIQIRSVSHGLYSAFFGTMKHATNPEPPRNINVTKGTTTTLSVYIVHGTGMVQSFYIQINESYTLRRNASQSALRTNIVIPNLVPGKLYDTLQIYSVSYDLHSKSIQIAPHSTVPDSPQEIQVTNQTTETISIKIFHGAGVVQSFIVLVNNSFCLKKNSSSSSSTFVLIPGLIPGVMYSTIKIQAQSHDLKSIVKDVPVHGTNPSQPVLRYLNSTRRSISIRIEKGKGYTGGYKILVDKNWYADIPNPSAMQLVNIYGRLPGQLYNIKVIAVSNNLSSIESKSVHKSTYPPVPQFKITGHSSNQVNMTVSVKEGKVEKYTATFENVNKTIHCGSDYHTEVKAGFFSLENLTAGTKYNVYVQSSIHSLTTKSNRQTFITDPSTPTFSFSKTSVHSVSITITKGSGCVHHYDIYVNGKKKKSVTASSETVNSVLNDLDDGKTFKINVLSVSYGQNSSLPLALTAATKQDPVPIAGGAVAGFIAAIVVVLLFIAWRKQLMCFNKRKPSDISEGRHNTAFDEVEVEMTSKEKKRPIKLVDIASQIDNKSGNSNMGFSQDFKDLGLLSPKHEMYESQIQENRPKNRYTNILPFDHSIVKLIEIEDEPGSDFINANYIPGYSSPREYIASQGPLPATLADFWRMVWEQNVSIIVMLTQLVERGRKKCELYWPEDTKEKRFFGDIIVEVESDSFLPEYALRIIVLRMGDVERRIRHYNYLAWPDMGTPKTSNNMITFVDTIRREVKPTTNGPILVHCSAGVGRTGTFIVMDILLQELRSGRQEVDIFGTILKLRNNRVNMVQTEDQYVFIFNCIKDFIESSAESAADSEPLYENVRVNSRKN